MELISRGLLFFTLHIQNGSSFPPALGSKEEQILLEQFKNGNIQAKNKLVEHNLRLVAHIVKKYYSNAEEQDDLISIGTIGLIKAINSFNSDKGIKLATFASKCIENEILMYFRGKKKSSQEISFNEPIDIDSEGNPLTLIDIISEENDITDSIDLRIKTEKLYEYIEDIKDEREKTIIIMRYGLYNTYPYTQKEVADKLNISRSYVSRIEKKCLDGLRKKFNIK
ncbi:MAG: RNA polymerase sporulation sigma factor SigK [Clostridia bacterium]|nr:RNA polymerase sporulation sigma factor SigK [Clostridia bacterium]